VEAVALPVQQAIDDDAMTTVVTRPRMITLSDEQEAAHTR